MALSKRLLGNALLVFAGISIALLLGEIALRIAGLPKPSFYTYDPDRGWRPRSGASGWQHKEGDSFMRINRAGFRGPEYSLEKPSGTLRVAVLGDSFTEARQLKRGRTFCAVIERELAGCCGFKRVEVLNFGCNGYGTAQELITLRREAWRYAPDAVVLAVFTGNDISNNSPLLEANRCRPFFIERGGRFELGGPFIESASFRRECIDKESHDWSLAGLIKDAESSFQSKKPPHRKKPPSAIEGRELGIYDLVYKEPANDAWRAAWRATEHAIGLIHGEAAGKGAVFLVVTLSNGIQVYPDPAARKRYMDYLGVQNLFYPDRRLYALGKRGGFEVLNLAPSLQEYADANHVFLHGFRNTKMGYGHWNAQGHRLAGAMIAAKLCRMLAAGRPGG